MTDQEQATNANREHPQFTHGVMHTLSLLSDAVRAGEWETADGSEDYDQDLSQTISNILIAGGLLNPDTGILLPYYVKALQDALASCAAAMRDVQEHQGDPSSYIHNRLLTPQLIHEGVLKSVEATTEKASLGDAIETRLRVIGKN